MKQLLAIGLLLTTTLTTANADLGATEGGDSKEVNGEFIPRDLIPRGPGSAFMPIIRSKKIEWFHSIPGFEEIFFDIGKAHPGLALAIWNDLMEAKIYLVDWELTILPAGTTSINASFTADEQVCIRGTGESANDIICSIPAFNRSKYQLVYPIHESLHSLVKGEGPFKHEKVRAMSKYLVSNHKTLTTEEVRETMDALDVKYSKFIYDFEVPYGLSPDPLSKERFGRYTVPFEKNIIDILFQELGTYESRCSLYTEVESNWKNSNGFHMNSHYLSKFIEEFRNWGDYNKCPKPTERFQAVINIFPGFQNYFDIVNEVEDHGYGYFYVKHEEPNSYECKRYGSVEAGKLINDVSERLQTARAFDVRVREEIKEIQKIDPALSTYLKLVLNEKRLKESVKEIEGAVAGWEHTKALCDAKEKNSSSGAGSSSSRKFGFGRRK